MKAIHPGTSMIALPFIKSSKRDGFTLIELMMAMTLGSLIMATVMTSFLSQQRTYLAQDDIIEMQQNGRSALDMLTRDIRSAGFDTNDLGAGITTANASDITFTRQADDGTLETIKYSLFDAYMSTTPPANDGLDDDLAREVIDSSGSTTNRQAIADNISEIEFSYLDGDGNITATLTDIRSIQISLLAVAREPDRYFNNALTTYCPASNPTCDATGTVWGPYNDNIRRRLFTTTINCRNLGL